MRSVIKCGLVAAACGALLACSYDPELVDNTEVVLHELEGYTHEEIALMLGIDPGSSRSQLHHARRRLRSLIGETHHDR